MMRLSPFAMLAVAAMPVFAGDAAEPPGKSAPATEFVRFEGMKDQFVISIPKNWFVYDQNSALRRPPGPVGVVQFSLVDVAAVQEMLNSGDGDEANRVLLGMLRGETPAFSLDRSPASKGMACKGFSEKARKTLLKDYKASVQRGNPSTIVGPPEVAAISVGGCEGLRIKLRATYPKDEAWIQLVYAVSDGTTLYDFFLRNQEAHFESNLPVFEKAIGTVTLTSAKR